VSSVTLYRIEPQRCGPCIFTYKPKATACVAIGNPTMKGRHYFAKTLPGTDFC